MNLEKFTYVKWKGQKCFITALPNERYPNTVRLVSEEDGYLYDAPVSELEIYSSKDSFKNSGE